MNKIKPEIRWMIHTPEWGFWGIPWRRRKDALEDYLQNSSRGQEESQQQLSHGDTCVKVRIIPVTKSKNSKGKSNDTKTLPKSHSSSEK